MKRLLQGSLCCLLLSGFPVVAEDHDFEWWTGTDVWIQSKTLGVDQPLELLLSYKYRREDDASQVFDTRYRAGFKWEFKDWEGWSFVTYYEAIDNDPKADERRTSFTLTKKWKELCGTDFNFEVRNRVELRDFKDRDDLEYRARFRFELSRPLCIEVAEQPVTWYASTEPYYDFEKDEWDTYRIDSGLEIPLTKQTSLTLGYRMESKDLGSGNGGWDEDHILLTELTFRF